MSFIRKNKDLAFVAALVAVIAVVFVPLPTPLMDLALVVSMALSLLTLLAVVYAREPLKFSALPSVLLLTTAFRLALNIATTRLILTNAGTDGTLAAGRVVRAFGEFVGGSEIGVGFVLFLIIIIVNFVVITRGATRISEVAARFTLDSMPGKQMAVDADLNAGVITADEARRRRDRIGQEADFHGAMDGAVKFVRGDAIAALLITGVNLLGGLLIGVGRHGMSLGDALTTYSVLTIGDGLVATMPALLVSIAAGLMVTRATAESNLGQEVIGQLFLSERRSLFGAGAVLGLLALTALLGSGMPVIPLLAVAALLAALGRALMRGAEKAKREAAARREAERPPERVESLLHVEPLEVELGVRMLRFGSNLMDRIAPMRRELATDLGIVVPPVVVREGQRLDPNAYVIRLRGVPVARGAVRPGEWLAVNAGQAREALEGVAATDPIFGRPAFWVMDAAVPRARELGYVAAEATGVIASHLREVVRERAAEMLSRDDVGALLRSLRERRPAVVDEVVPALVKPGELQKVLQNLLREGVSIRDLGTILEALGDTAARTKDPEVLTEYVRAALARSICQRHIDAEGRLYVITLDARLEDLVRGAAVRTEAGAVAALPPDAAARLSERVTREVDRLVLAGHAPVVLCSAGVRAAVKRLADTIRPGIAVLSYNEVVREVQIVSGAVVGE